MLRDLRAEGALPHSTRSLWYARSARLPRARAVHAVVWQAAIGRPEGVDRSQPEDITLLLYTPGHDRGGQGSPAPAPDTSLREPIDRAVVWSPAPRTRSSWPHRDPHITGVLYGLQLPRCCEPRLSCRIARWEPGCRGRPDRAGGLHRSPGSTPFLQGRHLRAARDAKPPARFATAVAQMSRPTWCGERGTA